MREAGPDMGFDTYFNQATSPNPSKTVVLTGDQVLHLNTRVFGSNSHSNHHKVCPFGGFVVGRVASRAVCRFADL